MKGISKMSIKDFFRKIGSFFTNLFRGFDREKVERVLTEILNFADIALPVVEVVAKLTPIPQDDLIVVALSNLKLSAREILEAESKIFKHGAKLSLATELLRLTLLNLIRQNKQVKVGDIVLASAADVMNLNPDVLRSAAQSAFTIWKTLQGKS